MEQWKKMWVGVFFLNTVYMMFNYPGGPHVTAASLARVSSCYDGWFTAVFYVICVEILTGVEIELLQLPKQGLIFYIHLPLYCVVINLLLIISCGFLYASILHVFECYLQSHNKCLKEKQVYLLCQCCILCYVPLSSCLPGVIYPHLQFHDNCPITKSMV